MTVNMKVIRTCWSKWPPNMEFYHISRNTIIIYRSLLFNLHHNVILMWYGISLIYILLSSVAIWNMFDLYSVNRLWQYGICFIYILLSSVAIWNMFDLYSLIVCGNMEYVWFIFCYRLWQYGICLIYILLSSVAIHIYKYCIYWTELY